jgi:hypothetical protein
MNDYTYPSVYFAYLFFALAALLALYFFLRSFRDGYWGPDSEQPKYRVLEDDEPFTGGSHGKQS